MMESDCRALLVDRIRQSGPITVAEYMDVALYAPGAGYYARAAQRSGRAGDFVTSVDVGPLFGELLAAGIAEFWAHLAEGGDRNSGEFHLIEVGAGNGRLSRDILDAVVRRHPALYAAIRLHLVDRSDAARAGHQTTLGPHTPKLMSSSAELPSVPSGIILANELIDAFPVHRVVMTPAGLAESYVDLDGETLVERLGPPSTPRLSRYFDELGVKLQPGAAVEVNLAAVDWIGHASRCLDRGFAILIDYGYEAATMYAPADATGTLTAFARHLADPPVESGFGVSAFRLRPTTRTGATAGQVAKATADRRGSGFGGLGVGRVLRPGMANVTPADTRGRRTPPWLIEPGLRDLTTHVDFTTLQREAERAGWATWSVSSQSRFLLDLLERSGLVSELDRPDRLRDRLALKSLLVPGAFGSSHSVLVFARNIEQVR